VAAIMTSPCAYLFSAASLQLLGNPADLSPQEAVIKVFPLVGQLGRQSPRILLGRRDNDIFDAFGGLENSYAGSSS